ncbi:hypothetical protein [Echinicola shivajiensis]|uniref:hypothetical protein n=1 Tax=Echinicola shivajiensis TaxID=1035916 RepID=UPI001BFC992A|nr:hypothetical protein [Echinicola shivajiensis]
MKKGELQNIIDQLESENLETEAYLGIFEYRGGPDESFIKANKEGLEYFALELLKAARDTDDMLKAENERSVFPLSFDKDWIDKDSTTFLRYVEPTREIKRNVKSAPFEETWKDKVIKIGCIGGMLMVIISGIVGIVTIIKWIF